MAKTKQEGYYHIGSVDKWVHFSMNAWINLQEERGRNLTDFEKFESLGELEQVSLVADFIYSAMLAYDQEEGETIDYNIYQVRNWMNKITQEEQEGFMEAMTHSLSAPVGKKKAKK